MIGVLILIHQHMAKTLLVSGSDLGEGSEEVNRLGDQVIEVKRIVALEFLAIGLKNLGDNALLRVRTISIAREILGILEVILRIGDDRRSLLRLDVGILSPSLTQQSL